MDSARLERELERFDGDADARRVVARQARDLADSGRFGEDFDADLSVETVVSNLSDAPDDHDVVQRWNWWIGSLEISHGDYDRFRVRAY